MAYVTDCTSTLEKKMAIIVIGVSGCGKTTIARGIACRYQYTFLDADNYHTLANKTQMASGIPLNETQRAPWLAALANALCQTVNIHQKSCVLAFSGLRRMHRDVLRKTGITLKFIYLQVDEDVLQRRLEKRKGHFMAPSLLVSQLQTLEPPAQEDDVIPIDANQPMDEVLRCIDASLSLLGMK